jgi:1-acyl-sn-glycerol-3-phosphate acyltransferase
MDKALNEKLNYCWRLIGTGFCFIAFGLGGLVLSFIVFPFIQLRYRDRTSVICISRNAIHRTFRLFIRMTSALGIVTLDLANVERQLDKQRGKVIIANHPSLIDVVVLLSLMPHADCVIKEKLWRNIFMSGVLSAAGYIRNSGDKSELINACDASLKAGYSVIVFPEGTRTTPGQEISLQRGASNIALRCGVDLVSVLINCDPTTLSKNEPWYHIPSRKFRFSLRMGRIFRVSEYLDKKQSLAINARKLTEHIRTYFMESIDNYGRA